MTNRVTGPGDRDVQFAERIRKRQEFFAQEPPPGYADDWAAMLAVAPAPEEKRVSVLAFEIAGLSMALPMQWMKAISPPLTICPVPHRDNTAFLGLVAHQGAIFPCCSLARILGIADGARGPALRTLVLKERPGEWWAFRVDRVLGVLMRGPDVSTSAGEHRIPTEWTDGTFLDDAGKSIHMLRSAVLFQRLQRATA